MAFLRHEILIYFGFSWENLGLELLLLSSQRIILEIIKIQKQQKANKINMD